MLYRVMTAVPPPASDGAVQETSTHEKDTAIAVTPSGCDGAGEGKTQGSGCMYILYTCTAFNSTQWTSSHSIGFLSPVTPVQSCASTTTSAEEAHKHNANARCASFSAPTHLLRLGAAVPPRLLAISLEHAAAPSILYAVREGYGRGDHYLQGGTPKSCSYASSGVPL